MLVKALKTCFIDGSRRKEGVVFEYSGKPASFLEPVKEGEAVTVVETVEMTDEEIKKRLGDYGVRFAPATGRKKLLALLAEAEGREIE